MINIRFIALLALGFSLTTVYASDEGDIERECKAFQGRQKEVIAVFERDETFIAASKCDKFVPCSNGHYARDLMCAISMIAMDKSGCDKWLMVGKGNEHSACYSDTLSKLSTEQDPAKRQLHDLVIQGISSKKFITKLQSHDDATDSMFRVRDQWVSLRDNKLYFRDGFEQFLESIPEPLGSHEKSGQIHNKNNQQNKAKIVTPGYLRWLNITSRWSFMGATATAGVGLKKHSNGSSDSNKLLWVSAGLGTLSLASHYASKNYRKKLKIESQAKQSHDKDAERALATKALIFCGDWLSGN